MFIRKLDLNADCNRYAALLEECYDITPHESWLEVDKNLADPDIFGLGLFSEGFDSPACITSIPNSDIHDHIVTKEAHNEPALIGVLILKTSSASGNKLQDLFLHPDHNTQDLQRALLTDMIHRIDTNDLLASFPSWVILPPGENDLHEIFQHLGFEVGPLSTAHRIEMVRPASLPMPEATVTPLKLVRDFY